MTRVFIGITCTLMTLKCLAVLLTKHKEREEMVIDAILTAFMVVSYACAIFITPSLSVQALLASSEDNAPTENEARYCEKCDAIKPEDFHHCSVCARCISHMDHHCPWTSNCVGLRTKKVFILFLFYTSVSCLWSGVLLLGSKHSSFVTVITALSFGIGFLLGGYFIFHIYLLQQGKTTLDFMAGRSGNKLGFAANFRVYFGHEWWLYPLPILPPSLRHGQLMRSDDECAKLHGDII